MSAPPIPYQLAGPSARAWPAWEHIWDALDDGEWHRGADLVEEALRDGVLDVEAATMRVVIARAARCGVIEREERTAAAFDMRTTFGGRPMRRPTDPWYRRPVGA